MVTLRSLACFLTFNGIQSTKSGLYSLKLHYHLGRDRGRTFICNVFPARYRDFTDFYVFTSYRAKYLQCLLTNNRGQTCSDVHSLMYLTRTSAVWSLHVLLFSALQVHLKPNRLFKFEKTKDLWKTGINDQTRWAAANYLLEYLISLVQWKKWVTVCSRTGKVKR